MSQRPLPPLLQRAAVVPPVVLPRIVASPVGGGSRPFLLVDHEIQRRIADLLGRPRACPPGMAEMTRLHVESRTTLPDRPDPRVTDTPLGDLARAAHTYYADRHSMAPDDFGLELARAYAHLARVSGEEAPAEIVAVAAAEIQALKALVAAQGATAGEAAEYWHAYARIPAIWRRLGVAYATGDPLAIAAGLQLVEVAEAEVRWRLAQPTAWQDRLRWHPIGHAFHAAQGALRGLRQQAWPATDERRTRLAHKVKRYMDLVHRLRDELTLARRRQPASFPELFAEFERALLALPPSDEIEVMANAWETWPDRERRQLCYRLEALEARWHTIGAAADGDTEMVAEYRRLATMMADLPDLYYPQRSENGDPTPKGPGMHWPSHFTGKLVRLQEEIVARLEQGMGPEALRHLYEDRALLERLLAQVPDFDFRYRFSQRKAFMVIEHWLNVVRDLRRLTRQRDMLDAVERQALESIDRARRVYASLLEWVLGHWRSTCAYPWTHLHWQVRLLTAWAHEQHAKHCLLDNRSAMAQWQDFVDQAEPALADLSASPEPDRPLEAAPSARVDALLARFTQMRSDGLLNETNFRELWEGLGRRWPEKPADFYWDKGPLAFPLVDLDGDDEDEEVVAPHPAQGPDDSETFPIPPPVHLRATASSTWRPGGLALMVANGRLPRGTAMARGELAAIARIPEPAERVRAYCAALREQLGTISDGQSVLDRWFEEADLPTHLFLAALLDAAPLLTDWGSAPQVLRAALVGWRTIWSDDAETLRTFFDRYLPIEVGALLAPLPPVTQAAVLRALRDFAFTHIHWEFSGSDGTTRWAERLIERLMEPTRTNDPHNHRRRLRAYLEHLVADLTTATT